MARFPLFSLTRERGCTLTLLSLRNLSSSWTFKEWMWKTASSVWQGFLSNWRYFETHTDNQEDKRWHVCGVEKNVLESQRRKISLHIRREVRIQLGVCKALGGSPWPQTSPEIGSPVPTLVTHLSSPSATAQVSTLTRCHLKTTSTKQWNQVLCKRQHCNYFWAYIS